MRTVAQYQDCASEFEALAAASLDAAMQKRYADIAACYRLLARERERLLAIGTIDPEAIELEAGPEAMRPGI